MIAYFVFTIWMLGAVGAGFDFWDISHIVWLSLFVGICWPMFAGKAAADWAWKHYRYRKETDRA